MSAKPLNWRKPTSSGADFGYEDALLMADGIGGKYSIATDKVAGFLLWWAEDEFTFAECATVEDAKAKAEADWQERYAALSAEAA